MKTFPLFLMLLSWTVQVASGQPAANTGTDRGKTTESPKEATPQKKTSAVVQHFWFEYRSEPEPGRRVWVHVDDSTWTELYPSGTLSRYKIGDRTTLQGMNGTIVRKVAGDPKQTWTLNDGSFEVFIPDKDSIRLILAFRHYQDGKWTEWKPLALIHPID
jgi:hypothetical protein